MCLVGWLVGWLVDWLVGRYQCFIQVLIGLHQKVVATPQEMKNNKVDGKIYIFTQGHRGWNEAVCNVSIPFEGSLVNADTWHNTSWFSTHTTTAPQETHWDLLDTQHLIWIILRIRVKLKLMAANQIHRQMSERVLSNCQRYYHSPLKLQIQLSHSWFDFRNLARSTARLQLRLGQFCSLKWRWNKTTICC